MNIQVINGGAYGTMSDAQLACEHGAQMRLERAKEEMEAAIEMVNETSTIARVRKSAWTDFVHDEIPDGHWWDEQIARARNP